MRVCVVGCGAVGSLFAANLATLDDVDVIDASREHPVTVIGIDADEQGVIPGRHRYRPLGYSRAANA